MMMLYLVIFLPLMSAIISGCCYGKNYQKIAAISSTIFVSFAAVLAGFIFYEVVFLKQIFHIKLQDWVNLSGYLQVSWSVYIDSLSAVMLIVVTSVSALVHLYSLGYMHDDATLNKFFAYLSLFTFFMLMLVCADNLLQTFFGWEGVGLASYLLIGYWHQKTSAYMAAMKAFIVNRIADVFFALGVFLIYQEFNTLDFLLIFSKLPQATNQSRELIAMLLFIGCMSKSAQLFFHTWLPDAMEGPTPVSALIHAATMVTAGVFLVARVSPLFEITIITKEFITIIGALTAIFAATIAITQYDIKKIIAYSTCSQLGYMFFTSGLDGYSISIFHLMTHAFFKALLFLGAGSVIHALSGEQDIRKMGALSGKIPYTCILMWVGTLAICGFPPFAGYYSKDAMLELAFTSGLRLGKFAYFIGLLTAGLTTIYSLRLMFLVFYGSSKLTKSASSHVHESGAFMLVPMFLLAIGAIFSGFVGQNILQMLSQDLAFWGDALANLNQGKALEDMHHISWLAKTATITVVLISSLIAYYFYFLNKVKLVKIVESFAGLHNLFFRKYYFDEIYQMIFCNSYQKIAAKTRDLYEIIIDKYGPYAVANSVRYFAKRISVLQTGYIYDYLSLMFFGMLVLLGWLLFIL